MKRIPLYLLPIPQRPQIVLDHPKLHDLLHRTICKVLAMSQSRGVVQTGSQFMFIIQDGTTLQGIGGASVAVVDTGTFASGESTTSASGATTVTVQSNKTIIADVQIKAVGYATLTQLHVPLQQGVPQTYRLTPTGGGGGGAKPDLAKMIAHINASWIPELNLWSTSLQPGNITYTGITVKIKNLCWYTSEAENYVPIMYEHGYVNQARAARDVMLASNPWRGIMRDQMLYGSPIPIMQNGCGNSHVRIKTGNLANGDVYLVMADESTQFCRIGPVWNQNGDIAYQAINYLTRGDTANAHHLIDVLSSTWDGKGFSVGTGTYETRGLGAAGFAILVCKYDPRGIMPAVEAVAAKLQGPDGSFPNSYTSSLTPGIGDAESINRICSWYCPQLIGYLQSLRYNASTPPNLTYVPPTYIP